MFAEQLINGITLGSIYAVVALGYTLVFGVLDIINMAHGEIFMFGAFVGMLIVTKVHAPLGLAFVGAIASTAAMGYLLERFALRPLRGKPGGSHLAPLISTIGVSIILENVAHKLFGAGNHLFETPFAEIRFDVGPITVYLVQVVILAISILLMAGLSLWLRKTRAGKALRATAENIETAALLGVATNRIITATVVIAKPTRSGRPTTNARIASMITRLRTTWTGHPAPFPGGEEWFEHTSVTFPQAFLTEGALACRLESHEQTSSRNTWPYLQTRHRGAGNSRS